MTDQKEPRLAAILLAAGGSSRLGQPKQLVRLSGESLVRRAARLLLAVDAAPTVVVTGYQAEAIARELDNLPVSLSHNENWEQGMGYSIACGARSTPAAVDGVLIMLCDQWMLQKTDLMSVISAWKSDISRIILAEWIEEKRYFSGPPVIFPRSLIPELKFVKNESGAKPLIDQNQTIVRRIALQNARFDLDGPQDLDRMQRPAEWPN